MYFSEVRNAARQRDKFLAASGPVTTQQRHRRDYTKQAHLTKLMERGSSKVA
jgi:hypothetical protein